MKRRFFSAISLLMILTMTIFLLPGCSQGESAPPQNSSDSLTVNSGAESGSTAPESTALSSAPRESEAQTPESGDEAGGETDGDAGPLLVAFGDRNAPFTLYLYDNPTAAAIARHVGTASWQLPIYHYDDYDNWEVMQYYDIPS